MYKFKNTLIIMLLASTPWSIIGVTIADEIADSEAKALHSQANDNVRSMDKASVVNRVKGKETLPRPCSKPLPKFENKVQKVKCYRCGRLHRQEERDTRRRARANTQKEIDRYIDRERERERV